MPNRNPLPAVNRNTVSSSKFSNEAPAPVNPPHLLDIRSARCQVER